MDTSFECYLTINTQGKAIINNASVPGGGMESITETIFNFGYEIN